MSRFLSRRSFAAAAAGLLLLLTPGMVSASGILQRLDTAGQAAYPGQTEATTAPKVAGEVIKFFISILGVFFVILMVYGGYLWMNARGNEQQVEKAKNVITSAIIGLTIMLASYAITYFVITNLVRSTSGT